jgi:hypothetical protein
MSKFKNMKLRYKIGAGVATGATLIAAGGLAFAAWTTSGSGSGSAIAYTNQTSTVTASASTADTSLWPGNTTATALHFTVNNPNPYSVTFTTFSGGSITSVDGPHTTAGCATSDFQLTGTSGNLDSSVVALAGDTADAGSVSILEMKSTAPNACQGATVTVGLSIQGAQS